MKVGIKMENKMCGFCKYYQNNNGKYICKNEKSEKYNTSTVPLQMCSEFSKKNAHTKDDLKYYQALPLDMKIQLTRQRISAWIDEFGENGVYVSFSGGKDSTVLLDIVRKDYPNIEAVFVNTGLEYPSVRQFALSKENVTELRPTMNFRDVIIKYGYPIISKEVAGKVGEVRKSIEKGNTNTAKYRQLMGLYKKQNGEPSEYNIDHYKYLLDAPFLMHDKCCEIMKKYPIYIYITTKRNELHLLR